MAKRKTEKQVKQEQEDALDIARGNDDPTPGGDEDQDNLDDEDLGEVDDEEELIDEDEDEGEDEGELEEGDDEGEDEGEEDEGEAEDKDEPTFTMPDGTVVKMSEITPEVAEKAFGGWNQQAHHQKLAEERQQELEKARRAAEEAQQLWVRQQMVAQAAAQQQQVQVPQRPSSEQMIASYSGKLGQLLADGRITRENHDEQGALIAEYLYDQDHVAQSITQLNARIMELEGQLESNVTPAIQASTQEQARRRERDIQTELASRPGYEDLADPTNWDRLKEYVSGHVASSVGPDGKPSFDPKFTPDTMAAMWDAMMAPVYKAGIKKAVGGAKAEQKAKRTAAGGDKGKATRPRPKRRRGKKPTLEQQQMKDAMDFSDPRRATG